MKNQQEKKEKLIYKEAFRCKGNCDFCGNCAVLRGKSAETVYEEYLEGTKGFIEITMERR